MTHELATAKLMASLSYSIFAAIEALRNPEMSSDHAKVFQDRVKSLVISVDSAFRVAVQSVGAVDPMEAKATEEAAPAETQAFNTAKEMWERMFGKRGNPDVEAKIAQTTEVLRSKIRDNENARKAKSQPRERRRRRA